MAGFIIGVSVYAANEPSIASEERQSRPRLEDVRLVESGRVEAVAWALALLIGVPSIISAYFRAWIIHRRGGNINAHRKIILVASVALASTGVLMFAQGLACPLEMMASLPIGPATKAMFFLNVAHSLKQLTVSLLATTAGVLACILLPAKRPITEHPQPVSPHNG